MTNLRSKAVAALTAVALLSASAIATPAAAGTKTDIAKAIVGGLVVGAIIGANANAQPAPVIVQQIGHTIRRLKAAGFTILLVEQNFRFAATVADRHYVMEHGRVVEMIANAELGARMADLHKYLGV